MLHGFACILDLQAHMQQLWCFLPLFAFGLKSEVHLALTSQLSENYQAHRAPDLLEVSMCGQMRASTLIKNHALGIWCA